MKWIINAKDSVSVKQSNGWYKTSYGFKFLWLTGDQTKWGDGQNEVLLSSMIIFSKYGAGTFEFNFEAIAIVDGYTYKLGGSYNSVLSGNPYGQVFNDQGELTFHRGSGCSCVKMEVSQIPALIWSEIKL